jgi:hypothetical protein
MTLETLRTRLQFSVVLALFFPVLFQAMYGAESSKIILSWSLVVALLTFSYLLVEVMRDKILNTIVRYTNIFLLLQIFSYVVVLYILALLQNQNISYAEFFTFGVGFMGLLLFPVIILLPLLFNSVYLAWKEE